MDMKKYKWMVGWTLLLVIWLLLSVVSRAAEASETEPSLKESELYAQAAVLMDAESGRVLYSKNADEVLAMASTTKIMTCILALENGELSEMVEISDYAASMPKVKLGVRQGERYRLQDLLYSLMLESHNDAAVAIAEHIGRKLLEEAGDSVAESRQAVAAFAALMNEKAQQLGCENTWFITPNGLDAEETVYLENGESVERFHSTTAKELALIMSYCILGSPKSSDFLRITRTATYSFTNASGRSFACYNHNAFLQMMSGALSGKTGFTNRAGYCYVGALESEGRTFVVALLACGWPYNKNYKWADTRKLMNYGIDNYFYRSFLEEETVFDKKWLQPIPVEDGQTQILGETAYVQVEVRASTGEPAEAPAESKAESAGSEEAPAGPEEAAGGVEGLLMKAGEEITVEYFQKELLYAPVEAGTLVGYVNYLVDGEVYRREEIVTAGEVKKRNAAWCAEQIWKRFLISW